MFLSVAEHDDVALSTLAFVVEDSQGIANCLGQVAAAARRRQAIDLLPDKSVIVGKITSVTGHGHDLFSSQQYRDAVVRTQLLQNGSGPVLAGFVGRLSLTGIGHAGRAVKDQNHVPAGPIVQDLGKKRADDKRRRQP